jgi:hypothetical protein
VRRRRDEPFPAEGWDHTLADVVELFEVRVAREDELVEADRGILRDPFGDLLVAADERGAGAPADEPDAGPQVRVDLELVASAAIECEHSLLPFGPGLLEQRLSGRNLGIVEPFEKPLGGRPGLGRGIARDDVHADAEADRSFRRVRELADALDLLGRLRGRLTPGEVDITVSCRDLEGSVGGASEVDSGPRRRVGQERAFDVQVLAGQRERLTFPDAAEDFEELAGPR